MKRVISGILSLVMAFSLSVSAFAAEPNKPIGIDSDSLVTTDSLVEYTEYREDGEYFISEDVSDNGIVSSIYKVNGNQKVLVSVIESVITGNIVKQEEFDQNGNKEVTTLRAVISDVSSELTESEEHQIVPAYETTKEKYLRTDEYSISLVGKKATVATAAAAVVAASTYIPTTTATAIIKAAIKIIGAGVGAGVALLPNYLYVTSEVYVKKSVGKTYYRYYNDYFLDADRTQLIGEWTFRHRAGH